MLNYQYWCIFSQSMWQCHVTCFMQRYGRISFHKAAIYDMLVLLYSVKKTLPEV